MTALVARDVHEEIAEEDRDEEHARDRGECAAAIRSRLLPFSISAAAEREIEKYAVSEAEKNAEKSRRTTSERIKRKMFTDSHRCHS